MLRVDGFARPEAPCGASGDRDQWQLLPQAAGQAGRVSSPSRHRAGTGPALGLRP